MVRNKDYFIKNDAIEGNYKFVCQIITYLDNCRNKSVLKNDCILL